MAGDHVRNARKKSAKAPTKIRLAIPSSRAPPITRAGSTARNRIAANIGVFQNENPPFSVNRFFDVSNIRNQLNRHSYSALSSSGGLALLLPQGISIFTSCAMSLHNQPKAQFRENMEALPR